MLGIRQATIQSCAGFALSASLRSHEESYIESRAIRQRLLFDRRIARDGIPNCLRSRSFALAFWLPRDHRKQNETIRWPSR
jgi:hypothetical protein